MIIGSASTLTDDEQTAFVTVTHNIDRVLGVGDRIDIDA